MNDTTRIAASAPGIYAGLFVIEQGIFEIRQGNTATNGIMINAMGPACQPENIRHACFPALMIPVDGGFITAFIGIIGGSAGTRIHAARSIFLRRSNLLDSHNLSF